MDEYILPEKTNVKETNLMHSVINLVTDPHKKILEVNKE